MEKAAIIIVTYRRQELLDKLLHSLLFLHEAPWRVFIIDNEASPETEQLVEVYRHLVDEGPQPRIISSNCSWLKAKPKGRVLNSCCCRSCISWYVFI